MPKGIIQCQSCGMPLKTDQLKGTEKDGTLNDTYCYLCYQNGAFCYPGNDVEEFKNIVEAEMKKNGHSRFMRKMTRRVIPRLARWKQS